MNTKSHAERVRIIVAWLSALAVLLSACTPGPAQTPTPTPVPPTAPPRPTLSLDDTYAKAFTITDFDAAHSPVDGDANKYLIFGNLPVAAPPVDVPPDLAVFLGRWEGYLYGPPVDKDRKLVLVIQDITARGGTAFGWSGTNLQYPDAVGELHFRVIAGATPALEWQVVWPDGTKEVDTFTYDRDRGILAGVPELSGTASAAGSFELTRDRSFYVYKDYSQYLAGKRIYARTYQNADLERYGQGYLVYLPEGYEDQPGKTWPLIFFLHGYGDRGDNVFLLAKASPFMFIREQGPLPFIIVAPLLNKSEDYASFPEDYMDGVLAEAQTQYRVDPGRIYVTGLSMGGEATYRFALHRPDAFAAIAVLSGYHYNSDPLDMKAIKDLPVWAIHGANDTVIPLVMGKSPVQALEEAGGNVQFTVLEGHDHDTWTDTYSDPKFYDWLLEHTRP